ncbi:MAG: hypothetical protein LBR26_03085, partial [Prevotella sp.]|nr:hypothetical protein [Prevotella sp.]
DLWNNGDSQGPCPNGWQVPTSGELSGLGSSGTFSSGNKRFEISGDVSPEYLYLPATGGRDNAGVWDARGTTGAYWSSTVNETGAMRLSFPSISVGARVRAYGFSVRCIQKQEKQ